MVCVCVCVKTDWSEEIACGLLSCVDRCVGWHVAAVGVGGAQASPLPSFLFPLSPPPSTLLRVLPCAHMHSSLLEVVV
jgi:hypothetical protein